MSADDQSVALRTRRVLNDLQYSPNGKEIIGLSPRKVANRKVCDDNAINKLRKRTSLSLPDICSITNEKCSSLNKSAASTPSKSVKVPQSAAVPSKCTKNNNNISVIIEEKENPNFALNFNQENSGSKLVENTQVLTKSKEEFKTFTEIGVQCNKSDEDMLMSQTVHDTCYWKLMAHKRYKALIHASKENSMLMKKIDEFKAKNETLKEKNKSLLELISGYEEIKKSILDSEDCEEEDSGYVN